MHITINGAQVLAATITLPLTGAWTATISASSKSAISGKTTISIADGAMVFVGTTTQSELVNDRAEMRVVGGAAGLQGTIAGRAYKDITARVPIVDLLGAVGEQLSPTADSALLGKRLGFWCRAAGVAANELRYLLTRLSANWRMLPDGTVWVGEETWPGTSLAGETLIENDPKTNRVVIAADLPALLPGQTYRGGHVGTVTHQLQGPKLRTTVSFQ